MQIWTKYKPKIRLKAHSLLPGLCGMWLNEAIDYGMSQNKWPVRFRDDEGVLVDLVPEFLTAVWAKYASLMVRPPCTLPVHVYTPYITSTTYTSTRKCARLRTRIIAPNIQAGRTRIHTLYHVYDMHIYV